MEIERINLLLVDDDEDEYIIIRDLIAEARLSHITLDWRETYEKGVAAIRERAHDACLVDYRLDRGNGVELIAEAIAAGADAPMIILTGQGDREIDLMAMRAGAADYLVKTDLSAETLERALRYAIAQHRVQANLVESEEKFRRLVEQSPDAFFAHTFGGIIVQVNRRACEYLGYEREELIGMTVWDIDTHLSPEAADELWARVADGEDVTIETVHQRRDGTRFPVEVRVSTLSIRGQDLIFGHARDISERKRAEQQLVESEEKYRQIFENEQDAITVIDHETLRVLDANPAACALYGYSREAFTRLTVRDYSAEYEKSMAVVDELKRRSVVRIPDRKHRARDGRVIHVELTNSLYTWRGRPAILSIARDITERLRTEAYVRQVHKMEAVGRMAGGIAHDFNNILSIVLGYAELAADDIPESNPARSFLDEIRQASLRAKEVVRQLLAFTEMSDEVGKPVALGPVVEEALRRFESLKMPNVRIRRRLDEDVPDIQAKPVQIHQMVVNMVTNALEAMRDRGGELTLGLTTKTLESEDVRFDPDLSPGRHVVLTVQDTGAGIAADHLDRIFDPYFTTKEFGAGAGMGLAVVHGIVKGHGGKIRVRSAPGYGATFEVFFPALDPERSASATKSRPPLGAGEHILLVDDESSVLDAMRQGLERAGFSVTTEQNPLLALERFRADPGGFDLMITDMVMPEMDGDQLAARILDIAPGMPVILCTGFSGRIDETRAEDLGIRAFVYKPVDRWELVRTIRKVLDEVAPG